MKITHLIIDGMLSGTGIRDGNAGGYLVPSELGVSHELDSRISGWLRRYENAHYFQFEDASENQRLDSDGIGIARALKAEFPGMKITYFSNAKLKEIPFD
jgi:hypothetical protein